MQEFKSRSRLLVFIFLIIAIGSHRAFSDASPHGPRMVMIIRHAEKPDETTGEKDPNLSKQGFARADALAKVIPDHFTKPDFLIATKNPRAAIDRPKRSHRCPRRSMKRSNRISRMTTFDKVAHEVLTDPKFDGKVVLIAWHHGKIPELAKALGVKNAPEKWDPKVFDRVWQITYQNGVAEWKDLPQKALPGDAEK